MVGVLVAGLFATLLALWFASPTAAQEESAACEQYGCAQEAPPAEEGILTPDPPPAPPVESSLPVEEEVSSEEEIDDPPETTDADTPPDDSTGDGGTDGDGSTAEPSAEEEPSAYGRPLPGYPYAGEPCEEDRYCGMEGVEGPVQCAVYETNSGEEVYGCADPRTYDREGCYKVTFYTETGEPYSNLDTCSGERPYAPPEPPEGRFRYWEPPDYPPPYQRSPWDQEWAQCQTKSGAWDPHCGLEGIRPSWECDVFYDTVHGTVRGCYSSRDVLGPQAEKLDFFCVDELHLYDEAGRPLGVYDQCPKIREEYCGVDRCGARGVPEGWWCRSEEWTYGEMYGGERRVFTRCADPRVDEYWSGELRPEDPWKPCGVLLDERGRRVNSIACGGPGGETAFSGSGLAKKPKRPTRHSTGPKNPPRNRAGPACPATDKQTRWVYCGV